MTVSNDCRDTYINPAETGWYYLENRYYDPEVGRFLSTDTVYVVDASFELCDKNLYAYCDNNPTVREDAGGTFWETAFDVISLGASIVEVSMNPSDVLAWAGLVGDVTDLAPFVTGLGEAVDIYRASVKAGENAIDVAKKLDIPDFVRDAVGSYEIEFFSENKYIGKGSLKRAIKSAEEKVEDYTDTVKSIRWKSSKSDRDAFIDEYYMQKKIGGMMKDGFNVYNKYWSPGRRYSGVQWR